MDANELHRLPESTQQRLRTRGAVFATVTTIAGQRTPIVVTCRRPVDDVAHDWFSAAHVSSSVSLPLK